MNVNVKNIFHSKYMTNKKMFCNFIKEILYYKTALTTKYGHYLYDISTLYLERTIEKQSEVHKLLHKLSSKDQGRKTAID